MKLFFFMFYVIVVCKCRITVSSLLLGPIFLYFFLSLFYSGLAANCLFCDVQFQILHFTPVFLPSLGN
jgi:hypothetical protein